MAERECSWQIFVENRAAVLEALKQGQWDGILPAARGFLDNFAQFLREVGILTVFAQFPGPRDRRSIPIMFFCHTFLYRPLFNLPRLAPIERTLFRSQYILRQLGFKACVLGVWPETTVWPPLRCFVPEHEAESVVGKKLFAAEEATLGVGVIRHVLIDRGYLDGAWLSESYQHGTQVTIDLKEDRLILQEMLALSRLSDTVWQEVESPKRRQAPLP